MKTFKSVTTLQDVRQATHNDPSFWVVLGSEIATSEKACIDRVEVEEEMDVDGPIAVPDVLTQLNSPKQGPNDCAVFAMSRMSVQLDDFAQGSTEGKLIAVLK